MKLGLISDVHGDAQALEWACGHLKNLGASRICCAGDLVGYGPHPDKVVALLVENQVASVRGNHDRWALARPQGTPDEFGGGTPSQAAREFLNALPPDLVIADGRRIAVIVHGSLRSDMEYVTPTTFPAQLLRSTLASLGADVLAVGHTHVPMWYRCDQGLVVNPGSLIALPVVKSSHTFAIVDLDDLTVTFYHVKTGQEVEVSPWPEEAGASAEAMS